MGITVARRRQYSPSQIAEQEVASRHITKAHVDRQRSRLERTECTSVWAFDIWHGHDRDYIHGGFTGSGSLKQRCAKCGRKMPPQCVAGERCTECRFEGKRRYRDCPIPEDVDRSAFGETVEALASAGDGVSHTRLPTDDDQQLAAAVAQYQATGNLDEYLKMTGDEAIAADQRRRYRAKRKMVV